MVKIIIVAKFEVTKVSPAPAGLWTSINFILKDRAKRFHTSTFEIPCSIFDIKIRKRSRNVEIRNWKSGYALYSTDYKM